MAAQVNELHLLRFKGALTQDLAWDAVEKGTRGCSVAVLHMELS